MISVIFTYALLALLCIPAGLIGRAIGKQIRRRERELRRQQAKQEQAEILKFYDELMAKGVINNEQN